MSDLQRITAWWRLAGLGLGVSYLVELTFDIIVQRSLDAASNFTLLLSSAIIGTAIALSVEPFLRRIGNAALVAGLGALVIPLLFLAILWMGIYRPDRPIPSGPFLLLWGRVAVAVIAYVAVRTYLRERDLVGY